MQVSPAHWHLLINHFPIILSLVGTLFIGLSFFIKKNTLINGGLILLVMAALTALPANATGEGAEESVEGITGVTHDGIEIHEHAAATGLKILIGTGILALITAFAQVKMPKRAIILLVVTFLAGLASAGYMSYVGLTGGEIRHSEIRGDFGRSASAATPGQTTGNQIEAEEDDD